MHTFIFENFYRIHIHVNIYSKGLHYVNGRKWRGVDFTFFD